MTDLAAIEAARSGSPAPRCARRSSGCTSTTAGPAEIYCKLEMLQPINSFKIRGATNAIRSRRG